MKEYLSRIDILLEKAQISELDYFVQDDEDYHWFINVFFISDKIKSPSMWRIILNRLETTYDNDFEVREKRGINEDL